MYGPLLVSACLFVITLIAVSWFARCLYIYFIFVQDVKFDEKCNIWVVHVTYT